MKRTLKKTLSATIFAIFSAAVFSFFPARLNALEKGNTPPVSPAWVFDHWVWEDDVNTEAAVMELVDGYAARGIPVGAVVIDSPWATEYNNFVFNRKQYPDPEGMIKKLHERGIKVILWMTAMLNEENSGGEFEPKTSAVFEEAKAKGYLCNGGKTYKWWKGKGAFVDYTNPEAVKWWHGLMDRVLDMGVDGWKVDGIDPMFPANGYCASGPMGPKKYKDLYYMDCYEHLLAKNPKGASWSRAVDILVTNPRGYAPISHSPVNWVGDQRHNWGPEGFLEALQSIFDSARLGYTVIGSDIPGYNGDEEITPQILLRWGQFGALCPLMENGGHGKHQPWLHDDETVRIYRKFVKLHHALKPYLYSMMIKGHEKKTSIMHVLPGKWQYGLGDSFFVAVMYTPENKRGITFPKGKWIDYFDTSKVFGGGTATDYDCPIDRYPLFVREGSIIPLYVEDEELGQGDKSFAGKVTLDLYPGGDAGFKLCEEDRECSNIKMTMGKDGGFEVSVAGGGREILLRALTAREPVKVTSDNRPLNRSAALSGLGDRAGEWFFDAAARRLYVNPGARGDVKVKVFF